MCKHMVDRAINTAPYIEFFSAAWARDRTDVCMNLECFTDVRQLRHCRFSFLVAASGKLEQVVIFDRLRHRLPRVVPSPLVTQPSRVLVELARPTRQYRHVASEAGISFRFRPAAAALADVPFRVTRSNILDSRRACTSLYKLPLYLRVHLLRGGGAPPAGVGVHLLLG